MKTNLQGNGNFYILIKSVGVRDKINYSDKIRIRDKHLDSEVDGTFYDAINYSISLINDRK